MAVITFPKILNDRLTDEGARALADMFNTVENSAQKATLEIAEERFEKRVAQVEAWLETKIAESSAGLKVEIAQSEARLETKIAEVKTGIAQSEARLETKIAEVKTGIAQSEARIIKWMFIFWAGQIGSMIAILFVFLKK